eukprot:2557541-Pyramimonas_sp.AAC.1
MTHATRAVRWMTHAAARVVRWMTHAARAVRWTTHATRAVRWMTHATRAVRWMQASTDPTYQQLVEQQHEQVEGSGEMTQADKDAGKASVFKRNDDDLKARRETDVR